MESSDRWEGESLIESRQIRASWASNRSKGWSCTRLFVQQVGEVAHTPGLLQLWGRGPEAAPPTALPRGEEGASRLHSAQRCSLPRVACALNDKGGL